MEQKQKNDQQKLQELKGPLDKTNETRKNKKTKYHLHENTNNYKSFPVH